MKEFTTANDFLKIFKEEADFLRAAIKSEYEKNGGQKAIGNASPKNYSDLEDYFKTKFANLGYKIKYKIDSGDTLEIENPGKSFLKNFFYVNKNKSKEQHHQYQIDLCYIYAFGELRSIYLSHKNESSKKINENKDVQNFRIIVSSISIYGKEIEIIKKHIETKFGYKVEIDYRDVKYQSIGPLFEFYNSENENVFITKLIGKNYLFNEACVSELSNIIKNIPKKFLNNTVIIKLPDICDGDTNISVPIGKHKIIEFWDKQIAYLEKNVLNKKSRKGFTKEDIEQLKETKIQANYERAKCQVIISEMGALISFINNESRSTQIEHFINHCTIEEFSKFFPVKCSVPH